MLFTPFVPSEYRIKLVSEEWERSACAALRRAVFCQEQGLFDLDDRDAIDRDALILAAVACIAGQPDSIVGTVRIHHEADGLWLGSRLAVIPAMRGVAWLGTELIRHAVCSAHARGCQRFEARVQVQNVRRFESLHWTSLERIEVCGRPHVRMRAELAQYPPRPQAEVIFVASQPSAVINPIAKAA